MRVQKRSYRGIQIALQYSLIDFLRNKLMDVIQARLIGIGFSNSVFQRSVCAALLIFNFS